MTISDLILARIRSAYVIDVGELRESMPSAMRGQEFDRAVLDFADRRQIVLSQDCLLESLDEGRGYIRCGSEVYTTAAICWRKETT